jgi:hypothetical protein
MSETSGINSSTHTPAESEAVERARINGETAKIGWHELQRFFAQGNAVHVSHELDLIEVAHQMSADNKDQLEVWMAEARVSEVTAAQAQEWFNDDALMWAVVVRPWILVQPILKEPDQQDF